MLRIRHLCIIIVLGNQIMQSPASKRCKKVAMIEKL
jgi:hypothetical protein